MGGSRAAPSAHLLRSASPPRRRSVRPAIPLDSFPVTDLARSKVSLPSRQDASTPSAPVSSTLSLNSVAAAAQGFASTD